MENENCIFFGLHLFKMCGVENVCISCKGYGSWKGMQNIKRYFMGGFWGGQILGQIFPWFDRYQYNNVFGQVNGIYFS